MLTPPLGVGNGKLRAWKHAKPLDLGLCCHPAWANSARHPLNQCDLIHKPEKWPAPW